MNETQFNNFIYSCLSFACNAHFDEERYIANFINKPLNEKTFCEVIRDNYLIAEKMHFGVCFTMACWVYHLLYSVGIDKGYYLMETVEKGTGFPNYVILFKYNGEYRVCDLASQVIETEKKIKDLLNYSLNPEYYTEQAKKETLMSLGNDKYLNCSIEEYSKEYVVGRIVLANGIEDERIFTEIPTVFISEFLKQEKPTRN